MNELQKSRIERLIKEQNGTWRTPVLKIFQITETMFLLTYNTEDRQNEVVRISKSGNLTVPTTPMIYHSEYKPKVGGGL